MYEPIRGEIISTFNLEEGILPGVVSGAITGVTGYTGFINIKSFNGISVSTSQDEDAELFERIFGLCRPPARICVQRNAIFIQKYYSN